MQKQPLHCVMPFTPLPANPNLVASHSAPVFALERRNHFAKKHHIEHLVKYRPQPGYPNTFHSVNKTKSDHPHRATDIKHIGRITQTQ